MASMSQGASNAQCKGEPGRVAPEIDRNKCEGKADCKLCVDACPEDAIHFVSLRS
jgi:ferredoxin